MLCRLFSSFFFLLFFIVSISFAQTNDSHVIHLQTLKLNTIPINDDDIAFNEMLQRRIDAVSSDARLVNFTVLRHNWGGDSHDLVMILEFKNRNDLFSFYDDFGGMLENTISKEQLDKDNDLFNKFTGKHADEIYIVVAKAKK